MGYDLHVTRAADWLDTAGAGITADEWLALVAADPALELNPEAGGPYFATWLGNRGWRDWSDGQLFTKNPDRALLGKLLQFAERLGARVQGDDGELYTGGESMRDDAERAAAARAARPWWRKLLGLQACPRACANARSSDREERALRPVLGFTASGPAGAAAGCPHP